jgi:hypothetical protein
VYVQIVFYFSSSNTVSWNTSCSAPTMAPTSPCAAGPAPSPSELGPGMKSSPSSSSNPVWTQTPNRAVHDTAADCLGLAWRSNQPPLWSAGNRHVGFCTFPATSGAAEQTPGNRFFPYLQGGFCTPQDGCSLAASTTVQRYTLQLRAPPARLAL